MSVPIRFYIAGKYTSKERLKLERAELQRRGVHCECNWMDETYTDYNAPRDVIIGNATRDLDELQDCNMLLLDTLDESNTGGREVELGFILRDRWESFIVVIGPERNIFHSLAHFRFDSWEDYWKAWDDDAAILAGEEG